MCGIIGYLDKKNPPQAPVGRVLLSMLQALSCRGPDSAGVALFGPARPSWRLQIMLPAGREPRAAAAALVDALHGQAAVMGHEVAGAYLRVEVMPIPDIRFAGRVIVPAIDRPRPSGRSW